ncbi:MAG: hypothetical protein KDA67_11475 [Rhodobacteraceae bacterium]|nr:hypothetical protein [Paracoccaceae bacterium]
MEILLVLIIFFLAIGGLALGLMLGRGPLRGSCGGMSCIKNITCEGCPNREEGAGS